MSQISSSFPATKSPQILAVCTPEKSTHIIPKPKANRAKSNPKKSNERNKSSIRGPKDLLQSKKSPEGLLQSKKRKLKKNISGSSAESGKGGKQVVEVSEVFE